MCKRTKVNSNPVMMGFRQFSDVVRYQGLPDADEKSYIAGALLMYSMTANVSKISNEEVSMLQMTKIYREIQMLGMRLDCEVFGKVKH